MKKIQDVIIVEGIHDAQKIQSVIDADILWTNGSAVSKEFIAKVSKLSITRDIIVFTDPDFPGMKIRNALSEAIPSAKHAYIDKEKALGKGKVGVEHASNEDVLKALNNVMGSHDVKAKPSDVEKIDLITYNLIGIEDAALRRKKLCDKLNLGQNNGKQLLKQLHMFSISKLELKQIMKEIDEEIR